MKGKDAVEDVRGQEGDGVEEDVEEAGALLRTVKV